MAQAKPTLNPLTDTPKNKTEITKPFMIAYMQSEKATKEDIAWFKKLVSNPKYQKEYINQLKNEPYTDIDIPKVRLEFCKRFYPNLTKSKKTTKSFIDTIMDL